MISLQALILLEGRATTSTTRVAAAVDSYTAKAKTHVQFFEKLAEIFNKGVKEVSSRNSHNIVALPK